MGSAREDVLRDEIGREENKIMKDLMIHTDILGLYLIGKRKPLVFYKQQDNMIIFSFCNDYSH